MSKRKVAHDSFTIERTYPASPAKVFKAWAGAESKARWFVGPPGWELVERRMEVKIGGQEYVSGRFDHGKTSVFDARYHDIVPNQRLVYSYEMTVNGSRFSVSLATVVLTPEGKHTKMALTEQGVFFGDPKDAPGRVEGTHQLMDMLAKSFA